MMTKTATLSLRVEPVLEELIHKAAKSRRRHRADWMRLALEAKALEELVDDQQAETEPAQAP